jgi:predicted peptidase
MKRIYWKNLLFIAVVLTSLVCCRKKIMSNVGDIPGNVDTVPVMPSKPDTLAYTQTALHASINSNIGGFYTALPPSYDSNTDKHPLLVFLHGGGELGDGEDQLPLVLKNAIPELLVHKVFPISFTVSNKEYSFVIISPQFKEWPKPEEVESVVNYAISNYRIDTQRIYMVGLSMGGGATWEYAAKHGQRLAAMVPISGASWADSATAKGIAATNVPTWAFHNKDDEAVTYESTTRYIRFIQYYNPDFPVKLTLWPEGGHDAWTKATDPLYKEDGKNIYEWMLQYSR